jgi:glycosyltransferase involved in cell wall biosynthesis
VLIGRNEGDRLTRCLASVPENAGPTVYVDSGSSDGSVSVALRAGVEVVELSADRPFSAARARNAGFERLVELHPDLEFVQFVDGDCELSDAWLDEGEAFLTEESSVAAVCGYCTELRPEATVYNLLCDMEWNRDVGEIDATGGNVMLRVDALRAVGGYDESMIAGEEPDLCRRLRAADWRIRRIDAPMVYHDAGMERFDQWWTRSRRSGFVNAMDVARFGARAARLRALLSSAAWGFVVPLASAIAAIAVGAIALIPALLLYAALGARIYTHYRRTGRSRRDAALAAAFLILAKAPEAQGTALLVYRRLMRRETRLIEYKFPIDESAPDRSLDCSVDYRSDYGKGTPPFGGP